MMTMTLSAALSLAVLISVVAASSSAAHPESQAYAPPEYRLGDLVLQRLLLSSDHRAASVLEETPAVWQQASGSMRENKFHSFNDVVVMDDDTASPIVLFPEESDNYYDEAPGRHQQQQQQQQQGPAQAGADDAEAHLYYWPSATAAAAGSKPAANGLIAVAANYADGKRQESAGKMSYLLMPMPSSDDGRVMHHRPKRQAQQQQQQQQPSVVSTLSTINAELENRLTTFLNNVGTLTNNLRRQTADAFQSAVRGQLPTPSNIFHQNTNNAAQQQPAIISSSRPEVTSLSDVYGAKLGPSRSAARRRRRRSSSSSSAAAGINITSMLRTSRRR